MKTGSKERLEKHTQKNVFYIEQNRTQWVKYSKDDE
jgi:hypothetical protein